ncbi:MAG: phosphate-starvation-inducible PsiE family protein [Candidatus Hydrogenedentota bacterium]|nr:MAG: phosphate-starvation-inducible PsiE family protein [Candidatus Hydrogenedentota bacterium]
MRGFLKRFERFIILALLAMMIFVVFLSTIELAVILVREMIKPPLLLLNIQEMLTVFGFFMMVLIGIELMETVKVYLEEERIHVEVILMVAIIAIARKIITLDIKEMGALALIGIAAIILSLSVGFYALKKASKD